MTETFKAEFKALHKLTTEELEDFARDMEELFSEEEAQLDYCELPEALRSQTQKY